MKLVVRSLVAKRILYFGITTAALSTAFTNCSGGFQVSKEMSSLGSLGNSDPTVELAFAASTSDSMNADTPASVPYTVTASQNTYKIRCYLNSTELTTCASPISLATAPEGDQSIRIVAENVNGKPLREISRTIRIDRKAPVITVLNPPPATIGTTAVSLQFSVSDNFSSAAAITVECSLDDGAYAACTSPKDFSALAAKAHTIKLKATDAARNVSPETTLSFAVVLGAPTVTISQAPSAYINATSATLAFAATSANGAIKGYECSIDNGATFAACTSPKTYQALTDKTYDFAVRATDAANQVSAVSKARFTVDTVLPSAPTVTSNLTSPSKTTALSLSFSSADSSGIASYQCSQDGGAFAACTSPKPISALSSASHTFKVKATDQAGNVSAEGTYTIVIDLNAPVLNITSTPTNPTTVTSASFAFTATDTPAGIKTLECQLDTEAGYSNCTSPKDYPTVAKGSRSFVVRATDNAGNSSMQTYSWVVNDVVVVPPPTPTPPIVPPISNGGRLADCGPSDRYFPMNARLVPLSQKAQLQSMLDTYKIIRLEAGNYGTDITLRAGQQVYGYPVRTTLGTVTVEPGTANAILRGAYLIGGIVFPASNLSTHDNCFSMLEGGLQVKGGLLENNLFLSIFHSDLDMDTSASGALRNNRFLRLQSHAGGFGSKKPSLNIIGDAGLQSYGNSFVFVNQLGPYTTPIFVQNQQDISFVGVDVEDYDVVAGTQALLTTRGVKKLNIMGVQGGMVQGMLDIGAEEANIFSTGFFRYGNPAFILRAENKRASWFTGADDLNSLLTDENPNGTRIYGNWAGEVRPFGVNGSNPATLTGPRVADALSMVTSDISGTTPWALPSARPIADPAGPSWNVGLAAKPDDAPALQAMLDANPNGTILLEPRAYYIGTTLQMRGETQGIVGAGNDKTVIIAKNPALHIFETNASSFYKFLMMDLTLQGGRSGLHFNQNGQLSSEFFISHVTIRDMTEAGIFVDSVYGWDNGYVEYLDVYRSGSAFKLIGSNRMAGENPTSSYMDKVFFYRNQYVECDKGLELSPVRQTNLNFWVETSFRSNKVRGIEMNQDVAATYFIGNEFVDNAGDPALQGGGFFVNSVFRTGPAKTLFSQGFYCDGCTMSRGPASTTTLLPAQTIGDTRGPRESFLMNSELGDVTLGSVLQGFNSMQSVLFINNKMAPQDSAFSIPLAMSAYDTKGTPDTRDDVRRAPEYWLPGTVTPGSRMLRERK